MLTGEQLAVARHKLSQVILDPIILEEAPNFAEVGYALLLRLEQRSLTLSPQPQILSQTFRQNIVVFHDKDSLKQSGT